MTTASKMLASPETVNAVVIAGAATGYAAKRVTFQSYSKSARQWRVIFDLGSDEKNVYEVLGYAWRNNAKILSC